MDKKQLTINMTANFVAFVVNVIVTFFITPYLVRNLGREAYGFIPLTNNINSYIEIFTIALNSMASRFISIEINSGNHEKANTYLNSVLMANTVIAFFMIIPSGLMIVFINKIFNIPAEILFDIRLTFSFVFLNIAIALIGNVFFVATFCRNRVDLSSIRAIIANIIKVLLVILLFTLFKPHVYYIAIVGIVISVFNICVNILYTKKLLPEITLQPRKFNISFIKELISTGIWNSVNQLSYVLLSTLDLAIANMFFGSAIAGQYAIAKVMPSFILVFINSLVLVFIPQFTILYAKKNFDDLLNSLRMSIKIMGLFVTLPISFLIVFGDIFFQLWVPTENSSLLHFWAVFTITPMIFTCCTNVFYNIFTVTNKLKTPAIIFFLTGFINIITVIIIIKTTDFGIVAIPLVALIINSIKDLIFTPLYCAYCLKIKITFLYKPLMKAILCAATMLVVSAVCRFLIEVDSWIEIVSCAVGCAGISFMINILIMLDKNEKRDALLLLKKLTSILK